MRWVGRDESAGIVEPRKLLAVGYPFRFPELVAALRTDAEVDASLAAMRSSRIR